MTDITRSEWTGQALGAVGGQLAQAWRADVDLARARELVDAVVGKVASEDWSGVDVDADHASVEMALEVLREVGESALGVELADGWRRGVQARARVERLSELQALERRVRAATLTVLARYLDGRLGEAAFFFEAGVRALREAAGGDQALSDVAGCEPFGEIGRIYAEHLAVGIRVARMLREPMRSQRLPRLVDDASKICLQIPLHGRGYDWLHPLVRVSFFALAEQRRFDLAATVEWLASMDRRLARDDRLGRATDPLVDMELAFYRGDEVATRRHATRAHELMDELGLERQIAAIIARGWCRAC